VAVLISGTARRRGRRLDVNDAARERSDREDAPLEDERRDEVVQVVFFHRAGRVLVSSDLVFDLASHPSAPTAVLREGYRWLGA